MPAKRENRRRAQSRRGALALALICALTLAAGFALDALMPPGGAADEGAAASASPLRISEVMASNASAHPRCKRRFLRLGGACQHRRAE